jgi:putative restriction endonuclease
LKAFVGITDFDWFTYLSRLSEIDEVNFWQPGGHQVFRTLNPNEPFLFKLNSPRDYIVGGGLFAHSTILPISLGKKKWGRIFTVC